MGFSRREILKGMGAAGLTPLIVSTGCSSSNGGAGGGGGAGGMGGEGGAGGSLPPLPELPEYEWTGPLGPETIFEHGVASGDPLSDAVIIWTRISTEEAPEDPPEENDPLEVWWEVALDEAFEQRVAQGTVRTSPDSDFTAKIDATGLVWGRYYFYRFFAQGRQSPIGRTRLAPDGADADHLRFGVCSCSNYGFGWFHGYRHMAARNDLDAILHLGDYFYEYGNGTFPTAEQQLRPLEPPHETVMLEDYRTRFSHYRKDADLAECHRQHPFIVVWDDHETANNSWMDGAENHNPENEYKPGMFEGLWEDRLAAGRQAFFEWIPIREDPVNNPNNELYRTLKYGDLADIIMLDTRIEGREEQGTLPVVIPDNPDNPERIISDEQETWFKEQLSGSTARWKIIGNQVVMSLWQIINPVDGAITYANEDQWNGYPQGRTRMMEYIRDNDVSNVVVVTGDVHSSWAMDVTVGDGSYDSETREGAVGVEFVAPGITAPIEIAQQIVDLFVNNSPHIRYAEADRQGYLVLDVQPDKVQSDWYLLDGVAEDQGNETRDASWAVMDGAGYVVEMDGAEPPKDDEPPLAS